MNGEPLYGMGGFGFVLAVMVMMLLTSTRIPKNQDSGNHPLP